MDKLTIKRQLGRYHGVVEADMQGFFDAIDHAWMLRMVAERIEDRALLRLIKKGLNAGILDTDGKGRHPVPGTPPGGTVSAILAKVYRHDAVELGFERVVKQPWRGEAGLIRDADDFVWAVERQPEAERCSTMLGQRLGKFGLELSAEQTRVLPFSRQPPAPKTSVAVRGVEFRWDQDRAGHAHITRRTARKKRRNSRKRCTPWGRENRHLRLGVLCARRNAKLRGYDNSYGVPGNCAGLKPCFSHALGILQQWLNRRSQRRRYNGAGYNELLAHCNIERPRICGRPPTRVAASKA